MKKNLVTFSLAAGLAVAASAAAADYPERTVNMLVPFGAGGGTDVPARFFAAEMEEILGQNIVVSNVEGAGGTVGATQLSEADADGYNLGFLPVGTMTTQPHLRGTSYNNESWTPICMVSQGPFYLVVADDSPIETIDDFIAQANGDGLKFAGAGPGSMAHVAQLTLNNATGADSLYIPTGGGGEIATEINGGRADATAWFADFDTRFGWRALGIMSDERSEAHPDVPTSFFTQAGTPDDVVATLSSACEEAVATDSFAENMAGANRLIRYMGSDEFGPFFNEAFELNGQLLKDAGLLQ